ncbi:polysaccharide pyruvyl transferase family protein [Priestia aryabhattai]|uniref:polysaccharide pyruvyl transferase family protein n=1 Tax=Priestia aryabhattai TaxID=412384 RepID=UPI001C8DB03D|nr:polysaccharide pyruvyl transferase family protein [Priestia aryabhattai]MBY0063443.1 polysaccharide pyruvyl transferase family protein [Priestia aryabhattai]
MKKILIINAHSSKNKGDAAIIISMIQSIQKFIPNSQIIVSSRYPEDDDLYKEYGSEVVEQLTRFPNKNHSFFKRLTFLLKELREVNRFVKKGIIPSTRSNDIFNYYKEADIVVSCGGGFLYSHPKYHIEASLIMHLAQIYFATKLDKEVITYSQSIGPFRSSLSKKIANFVLKKVKNITIREDLSRTFLNDIGISNPVIVGDSAFSMIADDIETKELIDLDQQKFNVGVTVRQWRFPGHENVDQLYSNYIEAVAKSIEHLVNNYNANVYLVPQVTGPTPIEDDRISNSNVWGKLNDGVKGSVIMLDNDFTPQELKAIYSKFNIFIGTRMHSNIFSLSSHVPTVAIAYEPKTTGIMKMLSLSDYVLDINEITTQDMLNTIDKCIAEKENYRIDLTNKIPLIKDEAEKPARMIKSLIS